MNFNLKNLVNEYYAKRGKIVIGLKKSISSYKDGLVPESDIVTINKKNINLGIFGMVGIKKGECAVNTKQSLKNCFESTHHKKPISYINSKYVVK